MWNCRARARAPGALRPRSARLFGRGRPCAALRLTARVRLTGAGARADSARTARAIAAVSLSSSSASRQTRSCFSLSRRAMRSSRAAIAWSRSASACVLAAAAPRLLLEAGGVATRARQLAVGQPQALERIFQLALPLARGAAHLFQALLGRAGARLGLGQPRAQAIGLVARRDDLGAGARAAAHRPTGCAVPSRGARPSPTSPRSSCASG